MKQKMIYLLLGRPVTAVSLWRKLDLLQHIPARDTEVLTTKKYLSKTDLSR
jgi:hypothetical protein